MTHPFPTRCPSDLEALKTRVIRSLRKAWMVPIVLVGNHDKRHAVLTDGDTLASIGGAGVATVVAQSGPIAEIIVGGRRLGLRSEEHTSELQSLMRISYAGFCL